MSSTATRVNNENDSFVSWLFNYNHTFSNYVSISLSFLPAAQYSLLYKRKEHLRLHIHS